MSTYNEPVEWVAETLDSVINQTYKPYEIVVIVDNPDNIELVDYLLSRQKDNSVIKVYINEKNMGLVKSLNKGLDYCTGELIARIDADDIALEKRFEYQVEAIESRGLDVVGTGYYSFFDDEILSTHEGVENPDACAKILNYSNILAHPSWMMKREVPDSIGEYRNIDSCEDLDFLQRAVIKGYRIANVKEPLLKYRDNPHSISHQKRVVQILARDFVCKSYKHHKISSYTDYENYINSEKYKVDYKRLALFDEIYRRHDASLSLELIKKGGLLYYLHLKCKNIYINWWRKKR